MGPSGGETFGCVPERLFKNAIPYGDTDITIAFLTTVSEDA